MSSQLRFLSHSPNPCALAYECQIGIITSKGVIYPKPRWQKCFATPESEWIWKSKLDLKVTYRFSENRCARTCHASFLSRHMPSSSPGWASCSELSLFREGGRNEVHLGTSLTLVISPFGHVHDLGLLSIWAHPWPWSSLPLGTFLTSVICPFGHAGCSTFRQPSTVSWVPPMEGTRSHVGNRHIQATFPFAARREMPNSSLC